MRAMEQKTTKKAKGFVCHKGRVNTPDTPGAEAFLRTEAAINPIDSKHDLL